MQNEKLNPLTCELQVGDVVEVISDIYGMYKTGDRGIITYINKNGLYDVSDANPDIFQRFERSEIKLVERNGKPIEEQWQPKSGEKVWNTVIKQINVIFEFEGEWYLHGKRPNSGEQITQKIEERHFKNLEPYTGQDKPQIDFGKAGLVLTDGDIVVVTTGETKNNTFKAKALGGFEDTFNVLFDVWRDITAEANPIIEQLKQLMK